MGPEPGLTYDHLARTPLHRWWRPVLGSVLVAAGYLLVTFVVLFGGMVVGGLLGFNMTPRVDTLFADPMVSLVVTLLSIGAALPVVLGVAWLIQRRPPGTLSSVVGRLRWRWMMLCVPVALGAWVLGQIASTIIYALTGEDVSGGVGWARWDTAVTGLAITLLLVPLQAASEEYLFRGWVIQAFGAFVRTPWPGILVGAAGFTALHNYTGWGILDVFAFGAVTGWLAVRTGGLEAPIALHVINNVLGFGLSSAAGTLNDALRQGAVGWQSLMGTAVQLAVFVIVVLVLARRRGVETTSPAGDKSPPLPVNM
ncbi:type II CAAX endopeptidase family protein [Spongiactinospora sp. TRM90649]|uniref:CPBP family intramembrane glutamic endopeptidase n=1 Tax=Spongiactinospora sp. TRM90649 TaxID=3031114 RepID=UPI0023FA1744|nr:type II CAAX endopeptidase family protein [Spongiactinospora sp. TRM90649]MDF5755479.1 type II CAAX endopeptidase family protein [Spongiactinospora sp. TRM90649]